MENPFIITGYIKPQYFCDRREEAKRIVTCVTNGGNLVLMAPRRIGKSKLIDFCLAQDEIKDKFITITIDILRTSSIQEFTYELGRAVFNRAAKRGEKMLRMVVQTLKSINTKFGYDPTTATPTFSLSLGDLTSPQYTLEEIFQCIEQAEQKCIIAIDEFQQISYYPEKNMEAILRTHIQNCSNANFIFSGSERHILDEMFTERARPFYNSAGTMSLDVIPLDKYTAFVKEMLANCGRNIQDDVVAYVYDLFGGNTYYIQKVFHDAFNATTEGSEVTMQTVQDVIDALLLDNDRKFSETLSMLSLPQKELLYAIAGDGEATQLTSSRFVKKHQLRSASSVQAAVKKLLENHIITRNGNSYKVDDQLMNLWLVKS